MKPERIEEMRRNVDIVVAEAARNGDHKIERWVKTAELLHLLRCARAWAELETWLGSGDVLEKTCEFMREDGGPMAAILSSLSRAHGEGPDLLTAVESALARAKETT